MDETLYDTDMMAWADEQADALRARDWQALDIAHLLEELALVKERYVSEVENRLRQLLLHLLKLAYAAPSVRHDNHRLWTLTCTEQRRGLQRRLHRTPSLRPLVPGILRDAYDDARLEALQLFHALEESTLPETCPWTLEEVLREGYFPV